MSTSAVESNDDGPARVAVAGARSGGRLPGAPVLPTDTVFDFTADLAEIRRSSNWRFVRTVISRRDELRSAWSRIRSLPQVTVPLADAPASRELTAELRKRIGPWRHRTYAVAVLEVPREAGAYREGRSRRSMRYNIGRALTAGVSCLTLAGQDEVLGRFAQVVVDGWGVERGSRQYRQWTRNVETVPHASYFAAVGPDDSALVFAKVIIAGDQARLHTFIQNDRDGGTSSAARFLLAEYIVESLRSAGVRHVFVDTVLGLPRGLRYHQQLAGYTTCNITLVPA